MQKVVLKRGKEKALRLRHPWIFSGAVASGAENSKGELLPVHDAAGKRIGTGYFNARSSIIGRMVCFDETEPLVAMERSLDQALALRRAFFDGKETNAYRLVNGEGDFLPGLIVDCYNDSLVVQIGTLGMDRLREWWVGLLRDRLHPVRIYEKSNAPARQEEGLQASERWLFGESVDLVEVQEDGMKLLVPVVTGQKTGMFLDHREMRCLVKSLARDRTVLNCFAYTGAFTVSALLGGARSATSVDISSKALQVAQQNLLLNGFDHQVVVTADVFEFLREQPLDYSMVILDPPAFVKRRQDVVAGCRGYKDINRIAMQKMPAQSFLLTSSCSQFVNETLFQQVVFQASIEAGREVRILDRHHFAPDHPVNLAHPEGSYLKSLLLYVQ